MNSEIISNIIPKPILTEMKDWRKAGAVREEYWFSTMDSGPATCQSQAQSCPKISTKHFSKGLGGDNFNVWAGYFYYIPKHHPPRPRGYTTYTYTKSVPLISFTIKPWGFCANRNDFAPDTSVQCQISLKLLQKPPSTVGTVSRTSWGFYNLHMQHALWYPTRPKEQPLQDS